MYPFCRRTKDDHGGVTETHPGVKFVPPIITRLEAAVVQNIEISLQRVVQLSEELIFFIDSVDPAMTYEDSFFHGRISSGFTFDRSNNKS
jgi:hypothetical protein